MERTKPLIPGGENLNNHGVWFLECFFCKFCLNYAFKPLFLTSKKTDHLARLGEGGGGPGLNGQCPFKRIFFFWMSSLIHALGILYMAFDDQEPPQSTQQKLK